MLCAGQLKLNINAQMVTRRIVVTSFGVISRSNLLSENTNLWHRRAYRSGDAVWLSIRQDYTLATLIRQESGDTLRITVHLDKYHVQSKSASSINYKLPT